MRNEGDILWCCAAFQANGEQNCAYEYNFIHFLQVCVTFAMLLRNMYDRYSFGWDVKIHSLLYYMPSKTLSFVFKAYWYA